jgi:hypothetical protein
MGKQLTVTADTKNKKQNRLPLGLGRILMALALVPLELILLFFGGLGYFQLLFWLFHLLFTSIPFVPKLARLISGIEVYERNRDKLVKLSRSKWYRAFWICMNTFYLISTVILFRYNIRLIDFLTK